LLSYVLHYISKEAIQRKQRVLPKLFAVETKRKPTFQTRFPSVPATYHPRKQGNIPSTDAQHPRPNTLNNTTGVTTTNKTEQNTDDSVLRIDCGDLILIEELEEMMGNGCSIVE
jgi:hypothetical protein